MQLPQMILKPKFNFIRILFSIYTLIIVGFVTVIALPIAFSTPSFNFVIPVSIILVAILFVEATTLLNYNATKYIADEEKIIFEEGFINHQAISIAFKNIKEISLTQSFIQRFFNLGTLRILTAGSSELSGGGLKIVDILKSHEVYTALTKLVEQTLDGNKKPQVQSESLMKCKASTKTAYIWLTSVFNGLCSTLILYVIYTLILFSTNNFTINAEQTASFCILAFILSTIASKFLTDIIFESRKYVIRPNKIESTEGVFNYQYTTIDLRNVREVRLEQDFFQRIFNLGTIIITTPGNNTSSTQKKSKQSSIASYRKGIKMAHLTKFKQSYDTINSLINFIETGEIAKSEDEAPFVVYKPTFKFLTQGLKHILGLIVALLMLISFAGAINIQPITNIIYIATGLITIFSLLSIWAQKKNYDCTEYKMLKNRIEFEEGFIKHKMFSILYDKIREVHFKENFLQKMCKLGTISIITSGSDDNISANESGIALNDIENGKQIYENIKNQINKKEPAKINSTLPAKTGYSPQASIATKEDDDKPTIQRVVENITIKPNSSFFNIYFNQFAKILPTIIILFAYLAGFKYFILTSIGSVILSFLAAFFTTIAVGLNYKATKYELSKDKVSFSEGFFNNNYTSIDYKNITEIKLHKNFIQRLFKLGTIILSTSANTSKSGLKLNDIKDSDKIYQKIQEDTNYNIQGPKDKESKLVAEVQPKFYSIYAIFAYVIPSIIVMILLAIFGFSFTFVFLTIIPVAILTYIISRLIYKSTKFKIYNDKINLSFEFVNHKYTNIINANIREVHLKESFFQRFFKLGTLVLVTSFSGSKGSSLFNIKEPANVNQILQNIVKENKNRID